jgi:hypothetical protein
VGWWGRLLGGRTPAWDGTHGIPPSGNGASSFHLTWEAPSGRWVAAEAALEVLETPAVPRLVFWALQVSFVDRGRRAGGAHLGLQWHPAHPGSTAVNWGGYGPDGRELDGSPSALPSATGNPNTRDYPWRPGRPYRLRVSLAAEGWRGEVVDDDGAVTVVRDLHAGGRTLDAPVVWSEVFAACDEPAGTVRWSGLHLSADDGTQVAPDTVRVSYQPLAEGGCITTDVVVDGDGFVQRTATERRTPNGARLTIGRPA